MISWIQKYFQKHFRFVFFIVLIAVGLPMVVIYSQSSGIGQGSTKVRQQSFFHVNLANQAQARQVISDGELSGYLRAGYPALQGGQLQQYALQRVAGIALADELHLPAATPEQVAKYVQTLRAFQNQEGRFDQSVYTRFADSLKTAGSQLTVADVNRVLRDDARLEGLVKLVGGPGYVLPSDVKRQLSLTDSTWTIQIASLDYTGFNPAINPTEEQVKKFHDDNAFRYDVPVRPRLSYVEFKAANFAPPLAPSEEDLRAYYSANMARFPVPADPAEKKDLALPATATDNFPKVRAQVETALRDLASRRLAAQAANDLTVALFDRKLAANSPELSAFLTSSGLTPVAVPPFAPGNPPAGKDWLGRYAEPISRLNKDRYFSDPVATPDGLAVLLWNETLPAYTPLFTDVRDRVLADYRTSEKQRLFNERGRALKAQLQAAAATPGGFAEKATTEKLEVKSHAGFTLRQPPADMPQPALEALVGLEAGQVSDFVGLGDKGIIVYAQEKKVPDLTALNPRFAEVQSQLMAYTASNNENSYLGQLVEEELKKGNPEAALP
jgi:peptidyl-prolyl cis-trans isomerase D